MKVLIYFENQKLIHQSGIGRALRHQKAALESQNIDYTLDPNDPDINLVHINTLFFKSQRVLKKFQKKNIPVIVHGHSTEEDFVNSFACWKLMRPFFYHFMRKMYRKADYIITPTPYSKWLIENYYYVTCQVKAISNGIDKKEYEYSDDKVEAFRNYFRLDTTDKVVIGVGLLFERKGLLDFIEVARQMPNVKFIWFGRLAKILTQHKIKKAMKKAPENLVFPGYIDGDIIKGAFQGANALFFPSYEETEGIVVLEGLASGIPVVVREIGVYENWLEDSKNCYKGNSQEDFINKLNHIFTHDNSSIIAEGKKIIDERSINVVGKELKETYLDILKEKRCKVSSK